MFVDAVLKYLLFGQRGNLQTSNNQVIIGTEHLIYVIVLKDIKTVFLLNIVGCKNDKASITNTLFNNWKYFMKYLMKTLLI